MAVAFFMESLDTAILNTAMPSIAAALHVAPAQHEGRTDELHVEPGRLIPVSGWMADRYGTRRVFAMAIGIFSLGSFLCGVANRHLPVTNDSLAVAGASSHEEVSRRADPT